MYQAPVRWLIEHSWVWWFAIFIVGIAVYYGVYLAFHEATAVGKAAVALPVALVSYIAMWGAIATLAGYVLTLQNYYIFAGHISSKTGVPQSGLHVEVFVGSEEAGYDITDRRGFFRIGLKTDDHSDEAKNGTDIKISATHGGSQVLTEQTLVWKTNTDLDFTTD